MTVTLDDFTGTVQGLIDHFGSKVPYLIVCKRLRKGWDIRDAITKKHVASKGGGRQLAAHPWDRGDIRHPAEYAEWEKKNGRTARPSGGTHDL